jgi:hypothetical protein
MGIKIQKQNIPKIYEQKLKKSRSKIQERKFQKSMNKNYKNLGTKITKKSEN